MSHVVEPLFVEWQRFAPCYHSRIMLTHLRNNRVAWQRQQVPSPTSNHEQSRRHSLPTPRDYTPRSRGRRHSAPHSTLRLLMGGLAQLAALEERSPLSAKSNDHFRFSVDDPGILPDHLISTSSPRACLQYLESLADRRRLSLNTPRATVTSQRRCRSLVTPSCYLGNGVTPTHAPTPDMTSSSRDSLSVARTPPG